MNSQIDESLPFNDPIETPYDLDAIISIKNKLKIECKCVLKVN